MIPRRAYRGKARLHSGASHGSLTAMCLGKIERLVEIWDAGSSRRGRAECGAILSLAYTPEAEPGSYVLAHSGVAVQLLPTAEAEQALALRGAMNA